MTREPDIAWIGLAGATPDPECHGQKAAVLAEAAAAGLAVPAGFVLPPELSADPASHADAINEALHRLGNPLLVAIRPSVPGFEGAGGSATAILNVGVTEERLNTLADVHGPRTAPDLYRRLIHAYGAGVLGLEGEDFEYALYDTLRLADAKTDAQLTGDQFRELADMCLELILRECGSVFPQCPQAQVHGAVSGLSRTWSSPRSQRRRAALGQDPETPLAVIVQEMVLGLGEGCGAGYARFRDEANGRPSLTGRYLPDAQGEDVLLGLRTPIVLTSDERAALGLRELSLEEAAPAAFAALRKAGDRLESVIGDAVSIEFTRRGDDIYVLDVRRAKRSSRAAVQIAVDLAGTGALERDQALMCIDPVHFEEQLHPAIDPSAARDRVGAGLAASPGAASGPLVFSPEAAERVAAQNGAAVLALIETSPEDIRGMHAAKAVLTVRGGMTSHAAVVARGLGKPCIVGAKDLVLDRSGGQLTTMDGRVFSEGDVVTVDGTSGDVLAGTVPMIQPETTGAFATLLDWADDVRRLGVRANADTGQDAALAASFGAEGIGLCRTEHMFFPQGRITAMREMILAETEDERRQALSRLGPMQRGDFEQLFEAMPGRPVTVRLLDPPLHEFLPHGAAELGAMADSLGVPVETVSRRAAELAEFNPMLGKRGCRIGIAFPEIYEMQARAIFEAALASGRVTGQPVRPEIMVPLVSAVRELQVIASAIYGVAEDVRGAAGDMVEYTIGVMIETPRACLRAGDIAGCAGFLSFGTNDLTQMLYGLSRDDAGRFMPDYVAQEVFEHDPFHTLDIEGVGEIMRIAIERARRRNEDISIGLCGEHGGDPASIDFCHQVGLDYISCSPFRVPVARLAAAQAAIRAARGGE